MKTTILFSFFCLLFSLKSYTQNIERDLSIEKWSFSQEGKSEFLPAKVPGTVHTDLLKNNKILDPFYGDNEKKLQWIENENWIYKANFNISSKEIQNEHLELHFQGLDTYAQVQLNGKKILVADNMFRTWVVEAKKYLKIGRNELEIQFVSSSKKGKEFAKNLTYTLPENERIFVRKAQYQFGWDWGPRFVTAGIWKPIILKIWNFAEIKSVKHQQTIHKDLAQINFQIEINTEKSGSYFLKLNDSGKMIQLKKGLNFIQENIEIKNPKLWFPNGYGSPHLYNFEISLSKNQEYIDSKKLKIGLRTIELIQENDKIGKSFYFKVNGIPVYAKGANSIPLHSFLPETTKSDYEKLVKEARFANMNMLRVWGGGIYESDDFYDLCDENGILVWQDFMFACAMYPGDKDFLNNVKQEVIDQANRLQNHPSLAIWCGNNENDEGWKNWGWQKQFNYSKQDSTKIWNDYVKLFREVIPKTLDSVSLQKPIYHQSSPQNGWGRKIAYEEADVHYWGVWWGMEPFEKYNEKVGRFVSEFGFQGMPPLKTFEKFTKNFSLDDEGVKNHQKHKTGYETIKTYMERDYPVPKDFENLVYISQLLQARGMKIGIEAHRTAKPYNMGTLYWQLNDCWPVTSWSSVDFFGNRKASHYEIKRSFEDLIFTVKKVENSYQIYVVSDLQNTISGKFQISLFDFKGNLLWKSEKSGIILGNSSEKHFDINESDFKNFDTKTSVLKMSFESTSNQFSTLYYFDKPKNLVLAKPTISTRFINDKTIEISTDVLAKDVYLISDEVENFDDNFFDLLPGEKKIIRSELPIKNIKVKTLFDVQ